MSKIFITGSSDGLGLRAAQALVQRGHRVYLHARNEARAQDARAGCPGAAGVLVADLSSAEATRALARELNAAGPWDAVVHNAGVMRPGQQQQPQQEQKQPEFPTLFAVNTLAPYLLTCALSPPAARYVFLSSSMHRGGDASLADVPRCGYSDSKLHNVMMAHAFARRLAGSHVQCHSMDPGWVATKMGGTAAPDDPELAVATYVLLAEGRGGDTPKYWRDSAPQDPIPDALSVEKQDRLMEILGQLSGVQPPA